MATSVPAALRLLGSRNAGTPFEMASTPVSAVHPEANARSTRKTPTAPPVSETLRRPRWALSAVIPPPSSSRPKPTASMT